MYKTIIDKQNLISLNEETHTYSLVNSDIKFCSVTEFIGRFFETFDENKIALKLTKLHKYKDKSIMDILQDWEKRRERGTIVHKEIEAFINETNKDHESLNKTHINHLDLKSQQGIKFLQNCNIYKNNLLFPEVRVFSEQLKLAGTIDLMIYNKPKNEISLVDWKTNQDIKKNGFKNGTKKPTLQIQDCSFNKYQLQLSMYKYILANFYNANIKGLYILHLKENSYSYLNCSYDDNTIKEMIKYSHSQQNIIKNN